MDIKKTGEYTLDYEQLFRDEKFQSWIVHMLIESSQLMDPLDPSTEAKNEQKKQKQHELPKSPVQRA